MSGKHSRRKAREARKGPKPRQMLGDPGPYMVCRECGEPVNLFSYIHDEYDEFAGQDRLRYLHAMEYVEADGEISQVEPYLYDHEAIPVEGDPLSANTICDFCHSPDPKYVFVPRRPVRMPGLEPGEPERDYSSPWNCCDRCLQAVRSRNLSRMLDNAMNSPHSRILAAMAPEERAVFRASVRELYVKYIGSSPAGPYETKIRDDPEPLGRRGSARGM